MKLLYIFCLFFSFHSSAFCNEREKESCKEYLRCAICKASPNQNEMTATDLEKCPKCATAVCEGCQKEEKGICPTLGCDHIFDGYANPTLQKSWLRKKLLSPQIKMFAIGLLGVAIGGIGGAKINEPSQFQEIEKTISTVKQTQEMPTTASNVTQDSSLNSRWDKVAEEARPLRPTVAQIIDGIEKERTSNWSSQRVEPALILLKELASMPSTSWSETLAIEREVNVLLNDSNLPQAYLNELGYRYSPGNILKIFAHRLVRSTKDIWTDEQCLEFAIYIAEKIIELDNRQDSTASIIIEILNIRSQSH